MCVLPVYVLCTMEVPKTAVIYYPIMQFKAPTAQRIKKVKIKFKFSRLLSSHCDSLPDLFLLNMALLTQPLVISVQMTKHRKLLISKLLGFFFSFRS